MNSLESAKYEQYSSSVSAGDRRGNRGNTAISDTPTVTSTRSELLEKFSTRLCAIIAARKQTFNTITSYTDVFNSWHNSLPVDKNVCRTEMSTDECGRRWWKVIRKLSFATSDGTLEFRAEAVSLVQKCAHEEVSKKILKQVRVIRPQSDNVPSKESVQGDATQESVREQNTIITRDQSITESVNQIQQLALVEEVCSTEPIHQFPTLCGRWMPLKSIPVSTTDVRDKMLTTYFVPEDFLGKYATCAPNTIPFETFVYGKYDLELRFVVNANKFHCGKVLVSVKFDSYQADVIQKGFQAGLSRRHIILDLSANNEGRIQVPFRYHRGFVRNLTHDTATIGIRPGKFATIYVQVLSPLKTGSGGSNNMEIRPYYMYKQADFAGMSYKVALTQMDTIEDILQGRPPRALKAVLTGVEKTLSQLGKTDNQDKPNNVGATVIIPKPRQHFPNGKGISDASVLRMNPTVLTSYNAIKPYSDEPRTTLDIARIWGLRSVFDWAASDGEGKELFNSVIDPTMRSYTSDYIGQPTPLEYVSSFYQFWSGPIELRFDFVSNAFHTGAVIISAEYNRTSHETDECQSHSTYTKTFHLGDQKSCTFRIPYIYDTIMRRSTALPFCAILDGSQTTKEVKQEAVGIRPESKMRVKVRVINVLRPVSTAAQTIEVLVFMRAGRNFVLHGLCQASLTETTNTMPIDSFPNDNYEPVVPSDTRRKRDAPQKTYNEDELAAGKHVPREERILPKEVRNKWNEYKSLPAVQMDNGEKEEEDSTEDFNHGVNSFGIQSIDSQVNIKDILRRPVLLFNRVKVLSQATSTGFFIPLMPPSRMMQYRPSSGDSQFSRLVASTPQAMIMNLFRFWRGSMRYTIVLDGSAKNAVYVTHVPHSGTRLYANKTINTRAHVKQPIYGSGLTCEMIIPKVNQTACIEVPYDTENNWTLTFDEDALRNYAWRDKGDGCAGHLAITPSEDTVVSIWWSAGDDFEVANFYGMPECKGNQWAYAYNDEHARVQMEEDFPIKNVSTIVGTLVKDATRVVTPRKLGAIGKYAIPYFGPACALSDGLDHLDTVTGTITHSLEHITTKIDKISTAFGETAGDLLTIFSEKLNSYFQAFSNLTNVTSYCYDILLDILIAITDKSWTAIGVGLLRFLGKILGVSITSNLLSYARDLGVAFSQLFIESPIRVQAPPSEVTFIGILVGLVGTIIGVRMNPGRYNNYFWSLVDRLTDARGSSYLLTVLRYVEATFSTLKEVIFGALGYVSPEASALRMLSGASEVMNQFVSEAQIVTSEANASLMQDAGYRQRFWTVVMQAYQIQKILAAVPATHVSPIVSRLCNDVIRLGNEKFIDISSAPVRYEPFVICIEGSAGIGKSEMVEAMVARLLEGIKLKRPHSGATYYRMPGSAFWSGYRDQPVVVYDDWMNLTDPTLVAQQLSELYQLKSTSLFIPPMAHLEEKKIRGNPLIVILLCNQAFPNSTIESMAHTKQAIYRRRDVLLQAKRKAEYTDVSLRDMSTEEQTNFSHLEFRKYKDPVSSFILPKVADYEDTTQWLIGKFQKWHKQEQVKVQRRLTLIQAGMHSAPLHSVRLEDPFSLYYSVSTNVAQDSTLAQNAFLPSEILAAEVARIASAVQQHQELLEIPVPIEEPRDPFVQEDQTISLGSLAISVGTSRFMLSKIITFARNQLDSIARWWIKDPKPTECSICQEVAPRAYVCRDSMNCESPHYVCSACYKTAGSVNPLNKCPVCRSDNFNQYHVLEMIPELTLVGRLFANGLCTSIDVMNYLEKRLCSNQQYLYSNIIRLAGVFSSYALGIVSEISAQEIFVGGMGFDHLELFSNITAVMVQGDPFGDEESEEQEEVTLFDVKCNDEVLTDLCLERRDTRALPCLHQKLITSQPGFVLYLNGEFVIQYPIEVKVSELPCSDECPFADVEIVTQFYASYLATHRVAMMSACMGYINNYGFRERYILKIPRVFRPSWMKTDEQLDKELLLLTDQSWWQYLTGQWEQYKTLIYAIGGISVALVGYFSLMKLFSNTTALVEFVPSGDEQTRNLARTHRTLHRPRGQRTHFQAVETPDLGDVVDRYVARNYLAFEVISQTSNRILIGCGLYGRTAILPRHYVKALRKAAQNESKILLGPALMPHERTEYRFDEKDFIISATTDLASFRVPASYGMFKDIRKFIATDDDLSKPVSTEASILLPPTRRISVLTKQNITVSGISASEVVEDYDGERFEAYDVFCYDYSQPGACGSLVMTVRTQRPIVAMHFAGVGKGREGEGYGVIITKESLGKVLEQEIVVQMVEPELEPLEDAKFIFPEEINVTYLGSLTKEETVFLPKKTKIRPSVIQGVCDLKPVTQPCILDKTDNRYKFDDTPLFAGCIKHGVSTTDFSTSQLDRAEDALWNGWLAKMTPIVCNPKKLTIEEACVGFPGIEFYDPMVLTTSAGYPYALRKDKRKEDYITFIRDASEQPISAIVDPAVKEKILADTQIRKTGQGVFTPFIDTLKDERRKPEKLLKYGGTRIFCNPPIEYVIATRQSTLHFTAAFMKQRMNMQHAVGINVTGTDWTQLAKKLIKINPNKIVTIDYSNFGPGFNAGVAERAINLMIRWLVANVEGIDPVELRALLFECLYSVHICHNLVYRQKCGSPSGAPITTIINSIVNQLLILLAWDALAKDVCQEKSLFVWEEFRSKVALFVYGDDLIMAVSEEWIDKFNGYTITEWFRNYGIVATDASKQTEVKPYTTLREAEFLKHSFKLHPTRENLWQSALSWSSINDCTQWIWECADRKQATEENCRAALLNAHGHGPEKFNEFRNQINKALIRKKCAPILLTWEEIDELFYPQD